MDIIGEDPKGSPLLVAVLQRSVPALSFVTGKSIGAIGTSRKS
jgi:hypothetical protein